MAKSSASNTTAQQPVGVNRRTLLRTGAHAAWAIPAVQIVTQSPALAATGEASLSISGASAAWTTSGEMTVSFRIFNANTLASTRSKTLTITSDSGRKQNASTPSGWSESTSGNQVTHQFVGTVNIPGNGFVDVSTKLTNWNGNAANTAQTVTISVQPTVPETAPAPNNTAKASATAL